MKDYTCDLMAAKELLRTLKQSLKMIHGEKADAWIEPQFVGDLKIYNIRSNVKHNFDDMTCSTTFV